MNSILDLTSSTYNWVVKKFDRQQRDKRILIIGLENAGKTALIQRYFDVPQVFGPTNGIAVYSKFVKDERYLFLDCGGKRELQKHYKAYFSSEFIDGNRHQMDKMKKFFAKFDKIRGVFFHKPVLIIANKIDVEDYKTNMGYVKRCVYRSAIGGQIRRNFKGHWMFASATEGTNVKKAFKWIIKKTKG